MGKVFLRVVVLVLSLGCTRSKEMDFAEVKIADGPALLGSMNFIRLLTRDFFYIRRDRDRPRSSREQKGTIQLNLSMLYKQEEGFAEQFPYSIIKDQSTGGIDDELNYFRILALLCPEDADDSVDGLVQMPIKIIGASTDVFIANGQNMFDNYTGPMAPDQQGRTLWSYIRSPVLATSYFKAIVGIGRGSVPELLSRIFDVNVHANALAKRQALLFALESILGPDLENIAVDNAQIHQLLEMLFDVDTTGKWNSKGNLVNGKKIISLLFEEGMSNEILTVINLITSINPPRGLWRRPISGFDMNIFHSAAIYDVDDSLFTEIIRIVINANAGIQEDVFMCIAEDKCEAPEAEGARLSAIGCAVSGNRIGLIRVIHGSGILAEALNIGLKESLEEVYGGFTNDVDPVLFGVSSDDVSDDMANVFRELLEIRRAPMRFLDDLEGFVIMNRIGRGNFGEVFKIREDITGRLFAMKGIGEDVLDVAVSEGRKMWECRGCREIVRLHAIVQNPVSMIMNLMDQNLHTYLEGNGGAGASNRDLLHLLFQATSGISFMHNRDMIHRDIAARNCFLRRNPNVVSGYNLKLGDFGLVRGANYADARHRVSLRWRDPFVTAGVAESHLVDIWSLGILIFETFSRGTYPYVDAYPRPIRGQEARANEFLSIFQLRFRIDQGEDILEKLGINRLNANRPHNLDNIIRRCLSPRDTRFAQVAHIVDEMRALPLNDREEYMGDYVEPNIAQPLEE